MAPRAQRQVEECFCSVNEVRERRRLCQRYGYKLIGNDLLILRSPKRDSVATICAGTKVFGIRYAVASSRFPYLLPRFGAPVGDGWRTKVFCSPEELGVHIEETEVGIRAALFCHVGECGDRNVHAARIRDPWIRYNLYENVSRYIKGSALVHSLNGDAFTNIAYSPAVDSGEFHSCRVTLVNHLVDEVGITAVSSNELASVCDLIDGIVARS